MIPYDTKDYRASGATFKQRMLIVITLVALVALLGWMGEKDHQAKLEQVQQIAAAQCIKE
ncbi:hypothetical protein [Nitrosomonas sp.]|uniref:hypothetical protein n=1 Tax=Nitrosomonas sp. TaxID=42353 RepID=UPI0025D4C306|nr:hypothetical protein [Nitrosomonas sp.]